VPKERRFADKGGEGGRTQARKEKKQEVKYLAGKWKKT
jgi:hypothetical protein